MRCSGKTSSRSFPWECNMPTTTLIGLDIGQMVDYTALALIERCLVTVQTEVIEIDMILPGRIERSH